MIRKKGPKSLMGIVSPGTDCDKYEMDIQLRCLQFSHKEGLEANM